LWGLKPDKRESAPPFISLIALEVSVFRILTSAALIAAAAAAPVRADDWALKMFDAQKHDFGKVARGAKCEFHFKFRNPYVETVHVASVRSSCGCTTPTASKQSLETYDEASIVARFNTDQFLGQRGATLTVTFDKPFYAEVQLQVSGYIRSDVILSPTGVDFGAIDVGQGAERTIDVSYAGRADWRITGVRSGSPYLEGEVTELSRGGGQVRYQLHVTLKPGAPAGYLKEQVLLQTTDARAPELPVDVEGKIAAALTVNPALFLGVVQPGQKVTKMITIMSKKPFKITGVTASDSALTVQAPDKAAVVHRLPVVFTAGTEPGNVNYKITIATDLGGDVVGEVTAYAQITALQAQAQLGQ